MFSSQIYHATLVNYRCTGGFTYFALHFIHATFCIEPRTKLKENYDGYHFTWPSPDIYNPFSLFNAFNDGKFNSYWFGSGTPTYLIEMLNKFGVLPSEIGGIEAVAAEFDAPTERMTNITPLLYQSGYITIKGYDSVFDIYTLDIPNKEVRIGLMRNLIPSYITNDT